MKEDKNQIAQTEKTPDLIDSLFDKKAQEATDDAQPKLVVAGDGSQAKLFKNVSLWSFVGGIGAGLIILLFFNQYL